MATNRWRKFDATSFDQQLRLMSKMADVENDLVNNIYNAQNQTSNTDVYSINNWKEWSPWYSFTIKTPKGRLLKGMLFNYNDIGERLEFTDVKFWGEPITIPTRGTPGDISIYSKIWGNKTNAKDLAKQYLSWKNKSNTTLWLDDERTIDDELDKRYDALRKEYLKMFREYSQSRPDQRWDKSKKMAEALVKYNLLNK